MVNNFNELSLSEDIIKAISELGFVSPTAVQGTVIPMQLEETSDLVCLAQTGTGKTAAFGLPLIEQLDLEDPTTQALVLCPTRELCRQIASDLENYAKYSKGFKVVAVYGGSSIEAQIKALRKGCNVIVATPGRMNDLLKRKEAKISMIDKLILDEADEMLNMGFKEELDNILKYCPEEKRTLLFSATLPAEVESIAKKYMLHPQIVTIGNRNEGSNNVKHYYYMVQEKDRYSALKRIVDYHPNIYGIIFCRTRFETQNISSALMKDGYDADAIHGDLSQSQRDLVMKRFKEQTLKLLVATDVAARGIDVNNLTHVINYNLPDEIEQYTHRSGRTGRADKTGTSIAIINLREKHKVKRIEKIIGKSFGKAKIPTGYEVCSKKLYHLIDNVETVEVRDEIDEYLKVIEYKWAHLSKEEIIRNFLSIEFNQYLDYYKGAPDLNVAEPSQKNQTWEERESRRDKGRRNGERSERGNRSDRNDRKDKRQDGAKAKAKVGKSGDKIQGGYSKLNMNVGEYNGVTNRNLIRLLTSCGVGKKSIGRINVQKRNTSVELATKEIPFVIQILNNSDYKGTKLSVRESSE